MNDMYQHETNLIKEGYQLIGGIDEAGRGPLAGPLVVAICALPLHYEMSAINDSKKLTARQRERLYDIIIKKSLYYAIEVVSESEVDRLNIYRATQKAMIKLARESRCDYILTDAMPLTDDIKHNSIIKGDQKSINIAAASILAKVTRDRIMEDYDELYPNYGFKNHKGYGTAKHLAALQAYGVTPIHRQSFKPVANCICFKEN